MQHNDETRLTVTNAGMAAHPEHATEIVLPNMRGAGVEVGGTMHTLFRPSARAPKGQ